jgi:hypothetical protein
MSENTKIWDQLGRTDPKHTKSFKRGGGFTGTAIKPMWSYHRMTEMFGPCGTGWGVGEPQFQIVSGVNQEVMVYCTASIWYAEGEGVSRTVYGVGGDKIVTHIKANAQYNRAERWENDDEAFKKAFTDAVTNALKLIGVGADVHMGMFDDNKYVNTMRQEFAEEPGPPAKSEPPRKANGRPETGWREDGTRTPHSLRKEGWWKEFEGDLKAAESIADLTKIALHWSAHSVKEKWPDEWHQLAKQEINAYREAILQARPPAEDEASAIDQRMRDERAALAQHPIRAG